VRLEPGVCILGQDQIVIDAGDVEEALKKPIRIPILSLHLNGGKRASLIVQNRPEAQMVQVASRLDQEKLELWLIEAQRDH